MAKKRKSSDLTSSDNFCGCGGNTEGAVEGAKELGITLKPMTALNHWQRAVTTYQTNYPDTLVECTDISNCDPRRYASTDIHLTSPECTNHSLAKGKKHIKTLMEYYKQSVLDPAATRSRATMWDVPRFAEYHDYPIIIVENVPDARKWVLFDSWLHAMYAMDYRHEVVYANSKFFWPTPQSRDRMYIVFWKKGNKKPDLSYHPLAYCSRCNKNVDSVQTWKWKDKQFGVYGKRGQYTYNCPHDGQVVEPYYYAAFNVIDWTDKGTRIGDRPKALADNTMERIQYGIDKYGEMPFYFQHEHSFNLTQNIKPFSDSLMTQATRQTTGMVLPAFTVNTVNGGFNSTRSRSVAQELFTQTTFQSQMLCNMPFIINDQHSTGVGFRVRGMDQNINTLTTVPNIKVCFPPFIVENRKTSTTRPITEALSTFTGFQTQGILSTEAWQSFLTYYYRTPQTTSMTEAMQTIPTLARVGVVQYDKPRIEDCYYRMLKPHEGKRAMAFADSHIITGDSKEQFKQLGNAVTPPVLKHITKRCIQTLL